MMNEETKVETVETEKPQEQVDVQETETQETETETQDKKTFTKEEVERLVKGRLGREREYFAKSLGLEKYDDVKSFVEGYNQIKNTLTEKEKTIEEMNSNLSAMQNDVIKYKYQIKDDKFKEALALAKIKQEGTEKQLEEALSDVLKEYPSMRNGVVKVGEEAGNQSDAANKPKYSKEFLIANQTIPYFKQLLDQMNKK
jgi:predicted  nucleic acid-binding Zn-ribbon protein